MKNVIVVLFVISCISAFAAESNQSKHSFSASTMYRYAKLDKDFTIPSMVLPGGWGINPPQHVEPVYTYHSVSSALTYQYTTATWHAGASLVYDQGKAEFSCGREEWGGQKDKGIGLTLFGSKTFMECWDVSATVHAGRRKYYDYWTGGGLAERQIGNDKSTRAAASIEIARSFVTQSGVAITPHLGIDFSHAPTEKVYTTLFGPGVLPIERRPHNYTEIPLGVRLAKPSLLAIGR